MPYGINLGKTRLKFRKNPLTSQDTGAKIMPHVIAYGEVKHDLSGRTPETAGH